MQVETVHTWWQVLEVRSQQRSVLVLFDTDGADRLAWAIGACQLELDGLGGLGQAGSGQQGSDYNCFHRVLHGVVKADVIPALCMGLHHRAVIPLCHSLKHLKATTGQQLLEHLRQVLDRWIGGRAVHDDDLIAVDFVQPLLDAQHAMLRGGGARR